jgi:hypothetical protein
MDLIPLYFPKIRYPDNNSQGNDMLTTGGLTERFAAAIYRAQTQALRASPDFPGQVYYRPSFSASA